MSCHSSRNEIPRDARDDGLKKLFIRHSQIIQRINILSDGLGSAAVGNFHREAVALENGEMQMDAGFISSRSNGADGGASGNLLVRRNGDGAEMRVKQNDVIYGIFHRDIFSKTEMIAIIIHVAGGEYGTGIRRIDGRAIGCRDIYAVVPMVLIKIRIRRRAVALRDIRFAAGVLLAKKVEIHRSNPGIDECGRGGFERREAA